MSSKSIFIQTHATRTNRFVDGFDSAVYSNLAIGKVQGQCRTLSALVSPLATDDDVWRIVNLQFKKDGMNAYDAIAVLGAGSNEQATDWALQQFGQFDNAMGTSVSETSHQGLMRHLASPQYHAYQSSIRANELAAMQDMVTGQQVQWDGVDLKSHGGQAGVALIDMIKHDDHGLLLDAMARDDLNNLLASIGAEHASYDALIVEKHNLDRLMSRLSTAMAKASAAGVSITNVTQTEPFKKNKVTQIAVLFEMNDGQTVAIVFHNPDATPSKLLPQDTLISWKWLLNSRDISAAIQPNQGEDVQLPVLATRIMKLVNQNSARFKRQQASRAKAQQALDDARKRLGEQSEAIAALDSEMVEIQQQLDEVVVLNMAPEVENNEEVVKMVLADETGQTVYATLTKDDPKVWILKSFNYFAPGSGIFKSFGAETHGDELIQRFETKDSAEKWAIENGYKLASENNDGASVNPISSEDAARLAADLKKLNAGPEWTDGTGHRYSVFHKRIISAQEGDLEAVAWAKEWLADLDTQEAEVLKQEQERLAAQEAEAQQREAALQQAREAGTADNPVYQAWLNTLENLDDAKNHEFMAWVSERDAEFKQQWMGEVPATPDQNSDYALARISYFQQWAANHLSDRLRANNTINSDQEFLQNIINGTVEATTVDMDYIIELAEKYQDDESVNALIEQALEVINQAEQLAAQSVA